MRSFHSEGPVCIRVYVCMYVELSRRETAAAQEGLLT